MFEIKTQIYQEYKKIRDSGYMEEFEYEDFFNYSILFFHLILNNYF